jgi:hypothetical protein
MPTTITPAHKEQFLAADGPILTNTPPLAARGQPWRARGAVEIPKSRNAELWVRAWRGQRGPNEKASDTKQT